MSEPILTLKLSVEGNVYEKSFTAPEKIQLGRAQDCFIVLKNDSVSSHHLEIEWDSHTLVFRDLESSNGSFRMPQDSPFVEIKINPSSVQGLNLRLAQEILGVEWVVVGALKSTQLHGNVEKTLVENFDKTQVSEPKPPTLPSQSISRSTIETSAKNLPSKSSLPRSKENSPISQSKHSFNSADSAVLISGLVFALVSWFFYKTKVLSFLGAGAIEWDKYANDIFLLWIDHLDVVGLSFAIALVLMFVLKKTKLQLPLVSKFGFSKFLILIFWSAPFFVPMKALSRVEGDKKQFLQTVSQFREIKSKIVNYDYLNKDLNLNYSNQMTELMDDFRGSSVYYSFWYNFQKQRVLHECGGLGSEAWTQKRFCLTLLFALSVEAYNKIQPVYLHNTATHLVLLSSLDGVVRVLAAEGPSSEHLQVFVNSLKDLGMEEELRSYVDLLKTFEGAEFSDLIEALFEVRSRFEERVHEFQNLKPIPKQFVLDLLGPLEMGI